MSGRYRYEPSNGVALDCRPSARRSRRSMKERERRGFPTPERCAGNGSNSTGSSTGPYTPNRTGPTAETAARRGDRPCRQGHRTPSSDDGGARETTDRAEKAEALAAELEREVAAVPARHYGEEDEVVPTTRSPNPAWLSFSSGSPRPRSLLRRPCAWCWGPSCPEQGSRSPGHRVQARPPSGTGGDGNRPEVTAAEPRRAPRSDQGPEIKSDTQSPGPGRSDPRARSQATLTRSAAPPPARTKCPLRPRNTGPVTLTDEDRVDRVDLTKLADPRAYATFGEASRRTASASRGPAAAAEVEADGAYGRGLTG